MRILSAALVLNKGIDDWCGLFLSKLHCFPNRVILTLYFELEKVRLNQNGMKKKQRSWKKWTSHLSRRGGRIVFTARVTTLHSCCNFALVLLEKFSPSGQSEVRNILMYFINWEIGLRGQTSSSYRTYCKGTASKYFTQSTLSLITDKSRIAAVVIQPIMNRGLAIVLCKPVLVVQPDKTSRKTRTHRNKGDRNPPIVLDRRDTNGNA